MADNKTAQELQELVKDFTLEELTSLKESGDITPTDYLKAKALLNAQIAEGGEAPTEQSVQGSYTEPTEVRNSNLSVNETQARLNLLAQNGVSIIESISSWSYGEGVFTGVITPKDGGLINLVELPANNEGKLRALITIHVTKVKKDNADLLPDDPYCSIRIDKKQLSLIQAGETLAIKASKGRAGTRHANTVYANCVGLYVGE